MMLKMYWSAGLLSILLMACGGAGVPPTVAIAPTRTDIARATQVATQEPIATTRPTNPPTSAIANTSTPTPSTTSPTFINHTLPSYTNDFSVFEKSALDSLGCDEIQKPADILGALKPKYPIALCFVVPYRRADGQEPPEGSYLYRQGGLLGMYARLVIWRENRFQVIHSLNELAAVYAPIESEDEALAYAVAATGFSAEYGLRHEAQYVYLTDVIEDTFVKPDGDGFLVRLFYYRAFGCGPHEWIASDFHVTRAGLIERGTTQALFKDPKLDGLCVD